MFTSVYIRYNMLFYYLLNMTLVNTDFTWKQFIDWIFLTLLKFSKNMMTIENLLLISK